MSTLRSQAIPKHLKTVVLLAALAMPALTTGCRGLLGGSGEPTTPPVTTPPVTTPPVTPPPTPPPPPPPPPPGPQDVTAINHVVLMMQENRSFDSYFGMLNPYRAANGFKTCADGPQYCVDGIDDKLNTTSNVDDEYVQCAAGDTACQAAHTYSLFKLASTCVEDMTSSWVESYGDVNRFNFNLTRPIKMDGFVHTAEGFSRRATHSDGTPFFDPSGSRAMGYYDQGFLNYYYFMASSFAISDRWFSPVSSKTVPNRIATFSGGTTQGYVYDPGADDDKTGTSLSAKTIFQALDGGNVSWKIYYSETAPDGLPNTTFAYFSYASKFMHRNPDGTIFVDSTHIAPISQFTADANAGTLPSFAFIQAAGSDEHPGEFGSVLNGQKQVAGIVNALMASPSWKDSVFFFTYDEGGGPYDHVPPVPGHTNDFTTPSMGITTDIRSIAVNPDGFNPCPATSKAPMAPNHCDLHSAAVFGGTFNDPGVTATDAPAQQGFAAQLGFRTPNMIISPFSKPGYVGHTPMDHTAVMHFVESRFGVAPLTNRDAAQPDLLEYFDFVNVPWKTPPTPPAPLDHGAHDSSCTPNSMR